jgi:hypothetical protein
MKRALVIGAVLSIAILFPSSQAQDQGCIVARQSIPLVGIDQLLLNGEQIAEAYKVTMLPVVYIVGLDGKIIYCREGESQKDLLAVIEKYFKANGVTKTF